MGNLCCRAASGDDGEAVHKGPAQDLQKNNASLTGPASAGAADIPASATALGPPTALQPRASLGWYSAVDGYFSEPEEEWHDALSEIDLAEALEEWEEEQHVHVAEVDRAIQVLKAKGHLVPPEFEAAAAQQRAEAIAAEQLKAPGAPQVHVATVPPAPALPVIELARTRSQQLASALAQPAAAALVQQAAELAAEGRVLAAHGALMQLEGQAGGSLAELAALQPADLAAVVPAGASLNIARLVADAQYVHEALAALEDNEGWMVSREDSLKVYYRHQKGTTVHSMKFSAAFDHPLEHLLALAYEFDLVKTWNKFSLASEKLAEPSIYESYLYGAQWMMKPFKHMQALLCARGYDLAEEHRCLLVSIDDCTPEELPEGHRPLPKEWAKRKLINILRGSCVKMRPLPAAPDGTPRVEGSLLVHLDPHIPFIPAFLLNFVLGVLAPYVFNQMRKVLDSSFADEEGDYSRRIRANPELYGLVQRRLALFADELRPQQAGEGEVAAKTAKQRRKSRSP